MISQAVIDTVFNGHIHEPVSMHVASDDVIGINGVVRIPRKCSCGAVIELKHKMVDGISYMGWFE